MFKNKRLKKMDGNETISSFIKPLKSMDEVLMLIYLNNETNCLFQIEFITETFNSIFSTSYDEQILKVAISKFSRLLKISDRLLILKKKLKTQHVIIPISIENCLNCRRKISVQTEQNSTVSFSVKGCFYKKFLTGRCSECNMNYHVDYFDKDGKSYLYNDVEKVKYIITSNQTAFEIKLLEWLDINIVRNTMSFSGFSDSYNDFHNENKNNDIVIIK